MNKIAKRILLILLILILSFAVVSCGDSSDSGNSGSGSGTGSGAVTDTTVDKPAINAEITDSFTNTGGVVASQDIKHVTVEHTLVANLINVTISYEADYNFTRKQDSEIMLKVFDNQYARNTLFLYYYDGTLYYEYDDEKVAIDGFGSTSTFDTFFDIMMKMDVESYLFDSDFIDMFALMLTAADSTNMSRFDIDGSSTNITITDINLDTTKSMVNDFLEAVFGEQTFGTKLDALTSAFLGFNLSDLGNIEIGLFNASEVQVILKDIEENGETVTAVSSFNVVFSGTQADNINTYYYNFKYTTSSESQKITLSKDDDVDTNDYDFASQGASHYIGTIYINSLETEFDTEIKSNISTDNNDENVISLTIGDIITAYYADSNFYLNIDGLTSLYLGNGVDLQSLGFPRVVFSDINLAEEISTLISFVTQLASADIDFDNYIEDDFWDRLGELTSSSELPNFFIEGSFPDILLDRISSDGTTFTINIDTVLFGILIGDYETTIMEYITSALGIPEETIYTLLGAEELDDLAIQFSYDTATAAIGIVLYSGTEVIMEAELYSQFISEDEDFIIDPPTNRYDRDIETDDDGNSYYTDAYFHYDEYTELADITCTTLYLEGTLRIQGTNTVDMSAFMGAFIGDATGANTPFTFALNDMIYLKAYIWVQDGETYVWAELEYLASGETTPIDLLSIYTSGDAADYYISCIWVDANFIMPAEGLYTAFEDLLGVDNVFSDTDILNVLRVLTSDTVVDLEDDELLFTLAPTTSYGVTNDPIYNLIGVENMIADLSAKVTFAVPQDIVDAMAESFVSGNYYQPIVTSIDECIFDSVYSAKWVESVTVSFGNSITQTFALSFIGDSAEIVTGQYYYEPTAKLFGQGVTYIMVLTDMENGTKNIIALYFEDNAGSLQIDPSMSDPIPTYIGVVYDDGTIGQQPYEIVGFPYVNDINAANCISNAIGGVDATNYTFIIGSDSIKEVTFTNVSVVILNRNIYSEETRLDDKEEVPVVLNVTIDPYEYSICKAEDSDYNPIPTDLTLYFKNSTGSIVDNLTVTDFDWNFDQDLISYEGGWFYVIAYYNAIKVCMKVTVVAKDIDYIAIQSMYDSFVFEQGYYTLDSMLGDTYYMPTTSTEYQEIRIYFKTGNYRIIGTMPDDYVQTDSMCDGYYDVDLTWLYAYADNIGLDSTTNPLNGGKTNKNVATFGDTTVGLQTVTVTVLAPSRRVSTMTDQVSAITYLSVNESTGEIDESGTIWSSTRISAVGLGDIGGIYDEDGIYFEIDPYGTTESKTLPSTIIMTVTYGVNNTVVRWEYEIDWQASTIIDASGSILMPLAEENYSIAEGYIGTGSLRQKITVCIHNISGEFDELTMVDANTNQQIIPDATTGIYSITVNPYDDYQLPTEFTLVFYSENGNTERSYSTEWYWYNPETGEDEDVPAKFSYEGGVYILHTYVAEDRENSILQQQVTLQVIVEQQIVTQGVVYGLSDQIIDGGTSTKIILDPYETESGDVLAKITSNEAIYGLLFANGTTSYNLPITWINLDEAMAILCDSFGEIELIGEVYSEYESLKQTVTVTIEVIENYAADVSLDNLDFTLYQKEILDYSISDGIIEIFIEKPYLLDMPGSAGVITPAEYLFYLLESVTIYVENGDTYTMNLTEFLGEYDSLNTEIFTYNYGTYSVVERVLANLTNGSRQDEYVLVITTLYDAMSISNYPIYIETFNEDGGSIKYSNGYEVQDYIDVDYELSGTVRYYDVTWVSSATVTINGSIVISSGEVVTVIPSELIDSMNGYSIELKTTLSSGEVATRTFQFYAKNIDYTKYNAVSETDSNYNISTGLISINNIYDIYPFDASLIPTAIVPIPYVSDTGKYEIGNDATVSFYVEWIFDDKFGTDGEFDAEKTQAYIVATGQTQIMLASAYIIMYNNVVQEINLWLEVSALTTSTTPNEINNVDFDCDSVDFDDDNNIIVDPYITNYGGELVLPTYITVYFGANGTSHTFDPTKDAYSLSYSIYNIVTGEYDDIDSIPYTHEGHSLNTTYYGSSTDVLYLRMNLPDGSYISFTAEFYSREYESIAMQNFSDKDVDVSSTIIEGEYYIDPYNVNTFALPTEALFSFKAGEDIYIDGIVWTVYDSTGSTVITDLFTNNYFNLTSTSYQGGEYILKSSLSGYGVEAQEFEITVYVIDRSLSVDFDIDWNIENPFATVVSDMEDTLTLAMFVSTEAYSKYTSIANLVVPYISWNMENDDIGYDGIDNTFTGNLSAEGVSLGEYAEVTVTAHAYTFAYILDREDNIIDFNPYTLESEADSYTIVFYINDNKSNTASFVFTPYEYADLDDSIAIINFGVHNTEENTLNTFTIGNTQKTISIEVANKYVYSYTQLRIEQLNFGYGYNGTGEVEFVLDPLNPVIPTEVEAQGTVAGSGSSDMVEQGMVDIEWDDAIYALTSKNATEDFVYVQLNVVAEVGGSIYYVPFEVKVYLLNRTPTMITTTNIGYSTIELSSKVYILMEYSNGNQEWYMNINPTDEDIYDAETNTYFMPSTVTYYFKTDYENASLLQAVEYLGDSMVFEYIEWELSETIYLDGTAENEYITLNIMSCEMFYYIEGFMNGEVIYESSPMFDYDYGEDGISSEYRLRMTVENSSVEYVAMVTSSGYVTMTEVVYAADGTRYLKAEGDFHIDPYELNYASSFPTELAVKYENSATLTLLSDVEWLFDEDYLKRTDVINGSIVDENNEDVDPMTTMAEFAIYGTTIAVQFPIKSRDIDIEDATGGATALDGGTIYVLVGETLSTQLPNYLYYSFIYNGETDISAVPLSFSSSNLYGVDTKTVQTYENVYGTLGGVDDNNIVFTIEVIDPTVTSVTNNGVDGAATQGALIYDKIVVARNNNNVYTNGMEESYMPEKIIIDEDKGTYLTIDDITYVISFDDDGNETSYAKFSCSYTFITSSGSRVCGDAEGNTTLPIYFTVPVTSYDYTKIDSDLTIDSSTYVDIELNTSITTESMPKLTSLSGVEYEIFWDLSSVNTNIAGAYTAVGTYMTSGGSTKYVYLPVNVTKAVVVDGDITLSSDWYSITYSGSALDISKYITIAQFMRDSGEFGNVEGYSVTYSSNGGSSWVNLAPSNVGTYLVKIEIVDYNVEGYLIFEYNINQYIINPDDVQYYSSEGEVGYEQPTAEEGYITYEYNGSIQVPYINNLPTDDNSFEYSITYYLVDTANGNAILGVQTPINAGTYLMVCEVAAYQNNYSIALREDEDVVKTTYKVYVVITEKDVTYQLITSLVYNGDSSRQAEIDGLPTDYTNYGISVSYTYNLNNAAGASLSSLSNVGQYYVTVNIDGGTNYPDGYITGIVTIKQVDVVVMANTVTTTYLQDLASFDSALSIMLADSDGNPTSVSGLQGSDSISLFGTIELLCVDSSGNTINNYSFIGDYNLVLVQTITTTSSKYANYNIVAWIDGTYTIAKPTDGYVISNDTELQELYLTDLKDNTEVKWYLMPGNYSAITIDKNVALTIVGAYNSETGQIGVFFESITVLKGGLSLDVIAFNATAQSTSLKVGSDASDISLNRVNFARVNASGLYLSESVAISTALGYTGTVLLTDCIIYGYTTGIYVIGGSLMVSNSTLNANVSGIVVGSTASSIIILNTSITYSKSVGIRIYCDVDNVNINSCTFTANMQAIVAIKELDGSITVQNEFKSNAIDIVTLS